MYTFERFNFRLFSWFLMVLGFGLALSGMYLESAIFGMPGALTAVSFTGFNIDSEKKRYRKYDRFLWVYIGAWHPLPDPSYVTVVRVKLSGRRISPLPLATAQEGRSSRTYKMNLVVNSKERYIPLVYGKRTELLNEGLKIATLLGIKLLDHTTAEKHWIS